MTRQEVFDYCKNKYGTEPDYPWDDRNAVLRHKSSRKWYGVVLEVSEDKLGQKSNSKVDVLNLKSEPMTVDFLKNQDGFFPAYHMNKSKWISVLLGEPASDDEVKSLIDMSYEMTK
ncbi:MAG: MmcQ/YjbR family DNA-binding protein [Acutalibacteraceae bacterium]